MFRGNRISAGSWFPAVLMLLSWGLCVAPKTLRNWEQGHSTPNVTAVWFLRAVENDSQMVKYFVYGVS